MNISKPDILFLVCFKKNSRIQASKKAKRFLKQNNVPYKLSCVDDLSLEDLKYLIEIINLDLEDGITLQDTLFVSRCFDNKDVYADLYKYLLENNKELSQITSCNELAELIYKFKRLLKTPIAIKDEIAYVGYSNNEYQQFLVGEERDNPKWLNSKCLETSIDKMEWIIRQFSMPEKAYYYDVCDRENQNCVTKLFLPNTSIMYGGKIKWTYPLDAIDKDGYVIKDVKNIPVKMQVELDGLYREIDFDIEVIKYNRTKRK